MPSINDSLADGLVGQWDRLLRVEEGIKKDVLAHILLMEDDLVKQLQAGPTVFKRGRIEEQLRAGRKIIEKRFGDANVTLKHDLEKLGVAVHDATRKTVNDAFKASVMTALGSPQDIKRLATTSTILGSPSADWWAKQSQDTTMRFEQQIRLGVAQGETTDDIVRRVAGKSTGKVRRIQLASGKVRRVHERAGGIMDISKRNATALVRTAVHTHANRVQNDLYEANDDIIEAREALATLDHRTTDICIARDGAQWTLKTGEPTKDSPYQEPFPGPPPWHYQCRTVLIPITKSWDEIFGKGKHKLRDVPVTTRASMDGQVPAKKTYEGWLKSKPEQFQKDVLGKGRWNLWKAERISLSDLIDKTGRSLSIEELSELPPLSGRKKRRVKTPTPAVKPRTTKAAPPKPKAKQDPTPQPDEKQTAPEFPAGLKDLKRVKKLGGSTGAELMEDAAGNKWVLKRGGAPGHIEEEFMAEKLYRKLGVDVPSSRLYTDETGSYKLSRFIDGEPLGNLTGEARQAAYTQLSKHFATDAFMGNWDVLGMDFDNILIDATGKPWRIDVGGSLRRRAQGALKEDWGNDTTDLFNMLNPQVNTSTANLASGLRYSQIVKQVDSILEKTDDIIKMLDDPELVTLMSNRLKEWKHLSTLSNDFLDDGFTDVYTQRVAKHSSYLRAKGHINAMPENLNRTKHSVLLVDDEGTVFDGLRKEGVIENIYKTLEENGASLQLIDNWAFDQSISSWSKTSQAIRRVLLEATDTPADDVFWRANKTATDAAEHLAGITAKFGREAVDETVAAVQSLNYEVLSRINLPNVNKSWRTVKLIRTEHPSLIERSRKLGDYGPVSIKRGAVESFSLIEPVEVGGTSVTVQDVPFTRVVASYFHARPSRPGDGFFYGDFESEFLVFTPKLKINYVASEAKEILAPEWRDAAGNLIPPPKIRDISGV